MTCKNCDHVIIGENPYYQKDLYLCSDIPSLPEVHPEGSCNYDTSLKEDDESN